MKKSNAAMIGLGLLVLVIGTAGAAAMISSSMEEKEQSAVIKTSGETVTWNSNNRVQAQPACDDDNIVGKVAGGVIGGVAGSQIGKGNGKTAATIGGSVGGTLLGEEYIPTHNVTCR